MPDTTPVAGPGGGGAPTGDYPADFASSCELFCERLILSEIAMDSGIAQFSLDNTGLTFAVKPRDDYPALRVSVKVNVVAYAIDAAPPPPATGEGA